MHRSASCLYDTTQRLLADRHRRSALAVMLLAMLLSLAVGGGCRNSDDVSLDGDHDADYETADDSEVAADREGNVESEDDRLSEDRDDESAEEAPHKLTALDCLKDAACTTPMVAAHRGFHLEVPGNSLAALRRAAALGVEVVEVDVWHTADEVLVLMHDSTVDSTTDGTGGVREMTWTEISALTLDNCDPSDQETCRIPQFSEEMALARELGVLLYVDVKTSRMDLLAATIAAGSYYDVVLVRDGVDNLEILHGIDSQILLMPPVESVAEAVAARTRLGTLYVVELGRQSPQPELTPAIMAEGFKVQQDVMFPGDVMGTMGDYTTWKAYVEAGVWLLQSDYPELLLPAIITYRQTGAFPNSGPGADL